MATTAPTTTILETARSFFEACETGAGWDGCSAYCHADAGFSAQAGLLAEITTLQGYADWMQGATGLMPDARYELKSFAYDPERNNVCAYAVFFGTHTGEGGPVPPTGKAMSTDYVYCMDFEDGKIRHLTKIWNDGIALQQVGWA